MSRRICALIRQLLTSDRISRYTQPTVEEPKPKEVAEPQVNVQPVPSSPPSALKSVPQVDTKVNSHVQQDSAKAYLGLGSPSPAVDKNAKPTLDGPVSGSPQSSTTPRDSHSQWPAEGFKDMHLSGHEPRYFPGMMARASRRDSMRQGSMHDSDDVASTRSAPKRSGGKEEQS